MATYLFVYGTLLTDIPSSMGKFLRRRATLVGKATTPGTLYDLGMYPGFVANGDGTVKGELYRLDNARLDQTLEMIDAYESVTGAPEDEYVRHTITARVSDGGTFEAFTYTYQKSVADQAVIPHGDYAAFYAQSTSHQRFVNGE